MSDVAEHRTYSDDDVAHALAVLKGNGGNAKRTAMQLGVNRTTLRGWAGRHSNKTGTSKHVAPALVTEAAEKLAGTLEAISAEGAAKVLSALEHIELKTATDVRNMLVGVGITTEKVSFLRGGPTARTESLHLSLIAPNELRKGNLRIIEGTYKEEKALE